MIREEAIQEAKVFVTYCEEYWDEMVHHISEKQLEAIKYLIENEQ